jgi:SPP1 family predicted phage head-tail adaptor
MARRGSYRHRVEVLKPVKARDAYGAETITYELLVNVRASLQQSTGRERLAADQQQAEVPIMVKCRHSSLLDSVTADYRLKFSNRTYKVTGPIINVGMRNREIEIMCVDSDAVTDL